VKRATVHVFGAGDFGVAFSLCRFLKHHGIDVTIVTKHAVQVHPDHQQRTAAILPEYRWGWDRAPLPGEEAR
jgi:hypothetical protein